MTMTRRRNALIFVPCLLLIGLLGASDALAQKKGGGSSPPPGPVPPGTIYYQSGSGANGDWSMKGDGSGKVPSLGGTPTYQRHGDSRWFLQNRTDDNTATEQWFAVDESGSAVPMTNEPSLHWNGYRPAWAKDDSYFSYSTVEETASEWIGRLMVVETVWIDGAPLAGPPMNVLELRRPLWDETWQTWGDDEVDLARHDWSPSGDEVALTRWVWGEGWVIDIVRFAAAGTEWRRLAARAENPVWSLDGGRIAFNRAQSSGYQEIKDIWSIKADGTGVVQLTKYVAGKAYNGTAQFLPTWSPDGAYVAYVERVVSGSKQTHNIRRISAGGGSATSLTTDGVSSLPSWRP